jgi:hypothetical protein
MISSEALTMTRAIVSTVGLLALLTTGCTAAQLEAQARSHTELSNADAASGNYGAAAMELEKAEQAQAKAAKKEHEGGGTPPPP